jgi:hypothetical protein
MRDWIAEPEPPAPQGLVCLDAAARQLLARLAQPAGACHDRLAVTAAPGALVLTGPAEHLPWLDGVQYIAPRAEAPALWLPTTRRPAQPLDLLRFPSTPLLLLESGQVLPLSRTVPLSAGALAQIDARWHG